MGLTKSPGGQTARLRGATQLGPSGCCVQISSQNHFVEILMPPPLHTDKVQAGCRAPHIASELLLQGTGMEWFCPGMRSARCLLLPGMSSYLQSGLGTS